MSVDQTTVKRIARLARIAITDEEAGRLQGELSAILTWVEQLGEVATDDVEPLTSVVPMAMRMRDDTVSDGDMVEDIIRNAPLAEDGFFVVPKVVE